MVLPFWCRLTQPRAGCGEYCTLDSFVDFCAVHSEPWKNFAPLNRGRHLYSAGRTSRWASAHISSALLCYSLHFAWVVDDAKCIVVTRVCVSTAVRPRYCTDLDVTWGRGSGCPLVVHYWADLQSAHRLHCYGNITRTLVYVGCARVAD